MAGERGLDRHFRGFVIANFADHDDIGVGAQKCPHRGGKIEANLGIHLHLAQAGLRDFHGIFSGPDLSIRGIDRAERGMQCRCFSRTGRTDTKNQAVRFIEQAAKFAQIARRHFQTIQRDRLLGGENTQDDIFIASARRRNGRGT